MKYDSLMGKVASVFFCITCDDQAPWRAEKIEKCPTCKSTDGVVAAQRFQNLTTEKDGTVRG